VAERKIKFLSSVETIRTEEDDVFNSISLYVPSTFAEENIVDYDPAWVTAQRPLVLQLDVHNYKANIKGRLLDQWEELFRQDTNISVVLFVIVFLCDQSTVGDWEIDDVSIKFAPLTWAFGELFHISWFKFMFDPFYDGRPNILPANPGTAASAVIVLSNADSAVLTIPVDNYIFNDGVKDWVIPVTEEIVIPGSGSHTPMQIFASTVGSDSALSVGTVPIASVTPNAGLTDLIITVSSVIQGTDPELAPTEVPSQFFDLSLALAYQGKQDTRLSCVVSLVKLSLPVQTPDTNRCWIRSSTRKGQLDGMHSIKDDDRAKYYWGALFLMGCRNTWVLAHSEPFNIFTDVMTEWFSVKNQTGLYVGNGLSHVRLSGVNIKPFGYPSWLDSEVNVNDSKGFDILDEMFISYLNTISSSSKQDCSLSAARGVLGDSINAMMIAKYVDYAAANKCADLINEDGTLVNPVLADEDGYKQIQSAFTGVLQMFTKTKRVSAIRMMFPEYAVAKKGLTAFEAATVWKARYTDDLDRVTMTGGIVEE
jgi:hypothetical protein